MCSYCDWTEHCEQCFDSALPSTSVLNCEPQHQQQVEQAENVKPELKNLHSESFTFKFNDLRKFNKKLQSFTIMMLDVKVQIRWLHEMLTEINQTKPEQVRQLIDLTIVEQLLTNEDDEHQLTNDQRCTIVVGLLEAAKTVARQIVEEGEKQEVSFGIGIKQIKMLFNAWRNFWKASVSIAKMRSVHLRPSFRTDSFESKLNMLIGLLKHMELEQRTARYFNKAQANRSCTNIVGLFKKIFFRLLAGENLLTRKAITSLTKLVIRRKDAMDVVVQKRKHQTNEPNIESKIQLIWERIAQLEFEQNRILKLVEQLINSESMHNKSDNRTRTVQEDEIFKFESSIHLEQIEQLNEMELKKCLIEQEFETFNEEDNDQPGMTTN